MPSSSLLQDLLREKKAQSHRINKNRRRTSRGWTGEGRIGLEDAATVRQIQSSPIGGAQSISDVSSAKVSHSAGPKVPAGTRGMGSRELDEVCLMLI
jgi:hypothetical protein